MSYSDIVYVIQFGDLEVLDLVDVWLYLASVDSLAMASAARAPLMAETEGAQWRACGAVS